MSTAVTKPQIFEYSNYRKFLAALYEFEKARDPRFSYRSFSKAAGFASPNFLKLVIDGKRNLSHESIEKFTTGLKLSAQEAEFFRSLVLLNQAETTLEKRYRAEELMRSRVFRKLHPLKPAQHAYYSQWYHVPIRELVGTEDFREDADWIAKHLTPAISASEARGALETLQQLGLIRRDEKGRLRQTEALLSTGDEVASASVAQFHREMIQKGAEAIDRFASSERDISSLTLAVSEQGLSEIKELVQRFRKELLAIAQNEKNLDQVVQLNFQLFPVTQSSKKREAA
jgi:uncharacterized protein (TIGR02147 family)